MRRAVTSVLVALVAIAAAARGAFAADRHVPRQYPTIQAAADAAESGDRIVVAKGVYREHVVVDGKDGLTFRAAGRVVWDGVVAGVGGTCLSVRGAGTTVEGFVFRHGFGHVTLVGDATTVRRCTSLSALGTAIALEGQSVAARLPATGSRIERVVVRGAADVAIDGFLIDGSVSSTKVSSSRAGVVAAGSGFTIERCTFTDVAGPAIEASGPGTLVRAVRARRTTGFLLSDALSAVLSDNVVEDTSGHAIAVTGDDVLVERNRVVNASARGVDVAGVSADVVSNSVAACGSDGIRVVGVAMIVAGNRVSSTGGAGIDASDAGDLQPASFERNVVSDTNGPGFEIAFDAGPVVLSANRALRCGVGCVPAFNVRAPSIRVEGCTAQDAGGNGFDIGGPLQTGAALERSTATRCGGDGFRVGSGITMTMTACRSLSNVGEGLDHRGANSTMTGSSLRGNRTDFANTGSFATEPQDGQFGTLTTTTGADCDANN